MLAITRRHKDTIPLSGVYNSVSTEVGNGSRASKYAITRMKGRVAVSSVGEVVAKAQKSLRQRRRASPWSDQRRLLGGFERNLEEWA